ncbi:glycosyltransferase family 39 protein [Streptomyces sp. NPDC050625]|uniref:glycosyltransferase family 39 protein n=1 Tax=Streptomyces sp. NPDC050625 TaxID=3154629 RepID=UPI00344861F0
MSTSSAPRSGPATQDKPGRRATTRRPWHDARHGLLRALVLFVGVRLAGAAVTVVMNHLTHRPLMKSLAHSWDSDWYLHIAAHGYGTRIWITPSGAVQTDWAFFPLYPGLIRAVTTVLPLTPGEAALLVAWTAAVVAAWGIYTIGHDLYGRGVATVLVALWAVLPHSVVLGIAYTESVFSALAAWSLYCVQKGRWLWAGALAALAGLSRPSGFAVAVAVAAAGVHEAIRRRGRVRPGVWVAVVLGPLGWIGYVLWVGEQTGDLLRGYFKVQDAWTSRFDFGVESLHFLKALFLHGGRFVYPMALVIVVIGVLLFGLLCLDRAPLPLVVFAGVLVLLVVGASGSFSSKPRFLVPAFPLLIPCARALVRAWRARPAQALLVGGTLTAVSLLYGAYLTTVAHSPL